MKSKVFIEVFPSVEQPGGCCESGEGKDAADCCDDNGGTVTSECCGATLDVASASSTKMDYSELKQKIREQYQQQVIVHVYDYSLPIDRALAKRKLNALFQHRGFTHLHDDQIIRMATPAVVIDGQLVSFARQIDYPLLDQSLRIKS
jgi:hypothetical protein